MKRKILAWASLSLILMFLATPLASAQFEIRPGGTYKIRFKVKKPPWLSLEEGKWEIRAYFFDGLNCFNAGSKWNDVYTGWYQYRIKDEDWTGPEEERSFEINVDVVDYPRRDDSGMEEIPLGQRVDLRIRFIIHDIDAKFSVPEEEEAESGFVNFTIGRLSFQYQYKKEFDDYVITNEDFEARIRYDKYREAYRLFVDLDLTATVSQDAPSIDIFLITKPLELNLETGARPEDTWELPVEVKVLGSILIVVAVTGAVAYLALRKRGEEELPLEE